MTTQPQTAYRKDGQLKHIDDCQRAFDKLDVERCARCAERAKERKQGIPARAHSGYNRKRAAEEFDRERSADIKAHFASAKHRSGGCGPCCTYGDW